jgi:hypothetical protein
LLEVIIMPLGGEGGAALEPSEGVEGATAEALADVLGSAVLDENDGGGEDAEVVGYVGAEESSELLDAGTREGGGCESDVSGSASSRGGFIENDGGEHPEVDVATAPDEAVVKDVGEAPQAGGERVDDGAWPEACVDLLLQGGCVEATGLVNSV